MKRKKTEKSIWFAIIGVILIGAGFTHISEGILTAIASIIIGIVLIFAWYPKNPNLSKKTETPNRKQTSTEPEKIDDFSWEWEDIDRLWEIVNESLTIITNTVNPDTFFSRYNLIFEMLERIIVQEGKNNSSVTEELEKLKQSKSKNVDIFIERMWDDTYKKAQNLKTERGKINRVNKFKEELKAYESEMTQENIERYTNKDYS